MKAIKVTINNELSVVTVPEPTNIGLAKIIDADLFEIVRPWGLFNLKTPYKDKLRMIVDEEGRCKDKHYNRLGSDLYNDTPRETFFEPIVGDILIVKEGIANDELDLVGIDDVEIAVISAALIEKFNYLEVKNEIK